MRGVGVLYREFKLHLVDVAPRVSPLQVVSKLEEFLTKEFCSVILKKSGNSVLPLTGAGNRSDGRRIDLALVQGNLSRAVDTQSMKVVRQKMKVRAFIELKYLRNKHRFGFGNASDEIESTLKDLRKQIGTFRKSSYDRPVQVLKARFMISLYAGLWRASA